MSNIFISSEKNDSFAFFRGIDLQDLLIETESYLLEYRDKLNLPSDVTFGVELEYEGILRTITNMFIEKNLTEWDSKCDRSLSSGGEITSPVMTDEIKYWQELQKVCEHLSRRKADTLHNAGGHIHIGTCVLGEDIEAWRNFLKLYTAYENIIFRFVYGDKISARKKLFKYAPPIADSIYSVMPSINEAEDLSELRWVLPTSERRAALNFCNIDFYNPERRYGKNTLEFRSPNATTNAVVWQNNINVFAKMLVASKDKVMNEEFLDYKLKHEYLPYSGNEYMYNEVSLKNVLEFVDLVFDNNLDKIYFLRQYLKGFQENYGIKIAVRAKKFVK